MAQWFMAHNCAVCTLYLILFFNLGEHHTYLFNIFHCGLIMRIKKFSRSRPFSGTGRQTTYHGKMPQQLQPLTFCLKPVVITRNYYTSIYNCRLMKPRRLTSLR